MLVLGLAKCHDGLFGHAVQAAGSQGVCAERARLRVRLEGCGQAIRAGGRRSGVRAALVGGLWARGGPVSVLVLHFGGSFFEAWVCM